MQNYRNLSQKSDVSSFEISPNSIIVAFTDGGVYEYSYASAGSYRIEKMKSLAKEGLGLNSYISRYVKKKYESKIR